MAPNVLKNDGDRVRPNRSLICDYKSCKTALLSFNQSAESLERAEWLICCLFNHRPKNARKLMKGSLKVLCRLENKIINCSNFDGNEDNLIFLNALKIAGAQKLDVLCNSTVQKWIKSSISSSHFTDRNMNEFRELVALADISPDLLSDIRRFLLKNTEVALRYVHFILQNGLAEKLKSIVDTLIDLYENESELCDSVADCLSLIYAETLDEHVLVTIGPNSSLRNDQKAHLLKFLIRRARPGQYDFLCKSLDNLLDSRGVDLIKKTLIDDLVAHRHIFSSSMDKIEKLLKNLDSPKALQILFYLKQRHGFNVRDHSRSNQSPDYLIWYLCLFPDDKKTIYALKEHVNSTTLATERSTSFACGAISLLNSNKTEFTLKLAGCSITHGASLELLDWMKKECEFTLNDDQLLILFRSLLETVEKELCL
ncbi:hypothetical protein ACOME3_001641 [Neoechinorhynchus agilis]